jgi:hypothetical protein
VHSCAEHGLSVELQLGFGVLSDLLLLSVPLGLVPRREALAHAAQALLLAGVLRQRLPNPNAGNGSGRTS